MRFWRNPNVRAFVYQTILIATIVFLSTYFFQNVEKKLAQQDASTGFDFISEQASFDISESLISYTSSNTYGRALIVGVLNTFKIAIMGNILAILLGVFLGLARGSRNFLVNRIAATYIEIFRNIPLLLQLFFWYFLFADVLPSVREAWNPIPGVFVSNRGFNLASPIYDSSYNYSLGVLLFGIGIFYWLYRKAKQYKEKTGEEKSISLYGLLLIFVAPLLTWFLTAVPLQWEFPKVEGFNFEGGKLITPEFSALLFGLVTYTAAFIGESVRAGVEAVDKGQWEASYSLGLPTSKILRFIIVPQALRVIIPPVTSQILNLTKNSSLAVAIAYPDFVSVANTVMNQTGQAVELVLLIMLMYLFFSLTTSIFMNWYNKKVALVEK